jgi:hypothetical protein
MEPPTPTGPVVPTVSKTSFYAILSLDDSVVELQQCLHDLCLVRASEKLLRQTVVAGRTG